MIITNTNTQNSGGVSLTPEEVIRRLRGYPYNNTNINFIVFEGDLMITYDLTQATDTRLFGADSFLANHVKKVNIMGQDVEDMASLPDILTMVRDTYYTSFDDGGASRVKVNVTFTLDTDTIEGDLFGINYQDGYPPEPKFIGVNCKVKSLDCSSLMDLNVSMLNSPTEILEQGSIKGTFESFCLPLALKNLEQNAFARFVAAEGEDEQNCIITSLFMPSLTVPESLPQSLTIQDKVFFPALAGERTYKDYVAEVFNIDVTSSQEFDQVMCYDVLTGDNVYFYHSIH